MSLLKNILLVMVSPNVGWEEIDKCGYPTSKVMQGAFYPLLALLALSCFAPMIYDSTSNTLTSCLMQAIISFSMYLFTYFFASYLLSGFYPELARTKVSLARLNNYIIYILIFLVGVMTLMNFLPGEFAPLYFLMAYAGYMAWRGTRFLGLPKKKEDLFAVITAAMLLLFPPAIKFLLQKIIVQ